MYPICLERLTKNCGDDDHVTEVDKLTEVFHDLKLTAPLNCDVGEKAGNFHEKDLQIGVLLRMVKMSKKRWVMMYYELWR